MEKTKKRAPARVLRANQRIIILIMIIIIFLLVLWPLRRIMRIPIIGETPSHIQSIYVKEGKLNLDYPQGLAVNNKKNWLYVTSAKNKRIFVFDDDYKPLFNFGEKTLRVPAFLAIANNSQVYVTDRAHKAVLVFSESGDFIKKLKLAKLSNPLAITLDNKNNLYVSNTGAQHKILKYDSDGKLILEFGYKKQVGPVSGSKSGFFFPNGLAVDSKQNIYVADSNNGRIQIFNKNGSFDRFILTGGLPRGIALNEELDVLFVVDALRHNVKMYEAKSGSLKDEFTQLGKGDADVAFPNAIALKGEDLDEILIVDRENSRVQLFRTNSILDVIATILRPYWPLSFIPVMLMLLLLLVSRRRKYILSYSFIESTVHDNDLDDLLQTAKKYFVTPSLFEKLTKKKLVEKFQGALVLGKRFNHHFADTIKQSTKLSQEEADLLALAYHNKGISKPVILTHDKALSDAAAELGITVMDADLFHGR